jgi:hypothetical protein
VYLLRKHLLVAAGLIILFLITDVASTLWVAVVVIASLLVRHVATLVMRVNAKSDSDLPGTALTVSVSTFGSMALAAVGAIVLGLTRGWLPAVAVIVLFIGYFVLREGPFERETRAVARIRGELAGIARQLDAGQITDRQAATRADVALGGRLPRVAFSLQDVYAQLLDRGDLTAAQHRTALTLLQRHLDTVERPPVRSRLTTAVRAKLAGG